MQKSRKYYQELIKSNHDYTIMLKNFIQAFLFGGTVCIIGQLLYDLYNKTFNLDSKLAVILMYLSIILISGIFTAIGIYDNIGQIGKCGLAIPITGFANASVASAMEYHKEGIVLGIGANTLKIAGSVIVLGTVSAIIVSLIMYLTGVLV